MGDLPHEWIFADLRMDPVTGILYDNNFKPYSIPIPPKDDRMLEFLNNEFTSGELSYMPNLSFSYVLWDDSKSTIFKTELWNITKFYGENEYWSEPAVIIAGKTEEGGYDTGLIECVVLRRRYTGYEDDLYETSHNYRALKMLDGDIIPGYYAVMDDDENVTGLVGLLEDGTYESYRVDDDILYCGKGQYTIGDGTISISYFEGANINLCGGEGKTVKNTEVVSAAISPSYLISDNYVTAGIVTGDRVYEYYGDNIMYHTVSDIKIPDMFKVFKSKVIVKGYYSEPGSMRDENTIIIEGNPGSEYFEFTIKGRILDFSMVKLVWDNKRGLEEKETVISFDELENTIVVLKTVLPEGIPSERIKWKDTSGKSYVLDIREFSLDEAMLTKQEYITY